MHLARQFGDLIGLVAFLAAVPLQGYNGVLRKYLNPEFPIHSRGPLGGGYVI
jgi:hypothetical protein